MNSYSIRSWQIRLSLSHVFVLLGLILGSMTVSYFLGFTSGQTIGLENALSITATQIAKLPILSPVSNDNTVQDNIGQGLGALTRDKTSDVYAKLDEKKAVGVKAEVVKPNESGKVIAGAGITGALLENNLSSLPIIRGDEVIPLNIPKRLQNIELDQNKGTGNPSQNNNAQNNQGQANQIDNQQLDQTVVSVLNKGKGDLQKHNEQQLHGVEAVRSSPNSFDNPQLSGAEETVANEKWYVQLVTTKSMEDVTLMTKRLKSAGFEASYVTDKLKKGGSLYRVIAGPEKSKLLAERLLQQIKREKYIRVEPVIRKMS